MIKYVQIEEYPKGVSIFDLIRQHFSVHQLDVFPYPKLPEYVNGDPNLLASKALGMNEVEL
ncbi:hypothetical protein ASG89_15560 [Paenibacillus sp. Soil766]|uniref:hypothetical protein n=1 Tax=Paenibacillus sp. Soil766 TaxID=1736404 RepID=UPI000708FF87|nr:hypothetical protein [Paenibacillus sp. Soil766]KRF09633.1 hypothetical protein ASG89_15560 [Paenibacillus sp. Soil766]